MVSTENVSRFNPPLIIFVQNAVKHSNPPPRHEDIYEVQNIKYPYYLSRYSDSLRAKRSGDRITVGARFSAPVQTGPGAHPASYTMGTGSFPGIKRPRRGVDYLPQSSAEVEERVELHFYSPFWAFVACYRVNLFLTPALD